MDQQISNNQNEFIWTLLANGGNDAHVYAYNLQRLVNDFPQSGILHALYVHANDDKNLKKASAYFNGEALFKLINSPTALTGVPAEHIIIQANVLGKGYAKTTAATAQSASAAQPPVNDLDDGGPANYFNEQPSGEQGQDSPSFSAVNHFSLEEEPPIHLNGAGSWQQPAQAGGSAGDQASVQEFLMTGHHLQEQANPEDSMINTENAAEHLPSDWAAISAAREVIIPEPHLLHDSPVAENTEAINPIEEPKPELTQPSITHEHHPGPAESDRLTVTPGEITHELGETPKQEASPAAATEDKTPPAQKNSRPEKLIVDHIASTDFFMFDRAFGIQNQAQPTEHFRPSPSANHTVGRQSSPGQDNKDVSKYHDENMPYSFMWWLAKTRREHSGTYRPYVTPAPPITKSRAKTGADPLQQQYYENIFHLTTVDELDKNTTPPPFSFNIKRKEHALIDRFIQEEPQIKPQASDKIDNENKAKKSSEDRDELVTETLAAIYGDQMLFHKAIASYKKLMLKFPEKSAYFAGKIEQLEKKTN